VPGWLSRLCPTIDLSSGLELRAVSSGPALGSMLDMEATLKEKGKKKKKN